MTKPVILTGDRTTGPLHIGHYAGSLANGCGFRTATSSSCCWPTCRR